MNWRTAFVLIVLILTTSAFAVAQQKGTPAAGAGEITLEGGFIGDVPFPHHLHQKRTNDCRVCHQLYPQKSGAIGSLKKEGTLKNQQVMNSQCINCHRENENAGKAAGPTQCNDCHQAS